MDFSHAGLNVAVAAIEAEPAVRSNRDCTRANHTCVELAGWDRSPLVAELDVVLRNKPAIGVFWNDKEIGSVQHGGRFRFGIDMDGEVRFKYGFRSAKLQVKAAGATTVYLSWDRA